MAFNPITLDYDQSVQGELLRKIDINHKVANFIILKKLQERALKRAFNIDTHFNSQYNILTGDDRKVFDHLKRNSSAY